MPASGLFQSTFGGAVSSAGDVNDDGYADLLVGASGMDVDELGEGRAYLRLGHHGSPKSSPDWTADPTDQSAAAFGFDVAGGADVGSWAARRGAEEQGDGRVTS